MIGYVSMLTIFTVPSINDSKPGLIYISPVFRDI
jgi:hypothetical protein